MAKQPKKLEHTLIIAPKACNAFKWAKDYARKQTFHEWFAADTQHYFRIAGLKDPTDRVFRDGINPPGPFRSPHYSVTEQGMTGVLVDGWRFRPGELHLAHGGTLVLDEVDSFRKGILRTILLSAQFKQIQMSSSMVTPTDFTLVAMATEDGPRLDEVKKLCRVVHLDVAGNEIEQS